MIGDIVIEFNYGQAQHLSSARLRCHNSVGFGISSVPFNGSIFPQAEGRGEQEGGKEEAGGQRPFEIKFNGVN